MCLLLLVLLCGGAFGYRDPYKQPFTSNSIWNLPIGKNAKYVDAKLADHYYFVPGFHPDQDIIVLRPNAPNLNVYKNTAGWNHKNRCPVEGPKLYGGPVPKDFVVPNEGRNFGAAILLPDNRTLIQGQPFTRCKAGGNATSLVSSPTADLYGPGFYGAHGGSHLSAIGGTIRVGEALPTSPHMRHALKVDLATHVLYCRHNDTGRWPAVHSQSCGPHNTRENGTIHALMMGSLLAIPQTMNIANMDLELDFSRKLAWTLQNYGAYVVDGAGTNPTELHTNLCVELGPNGDAAQMIAEANGNFTWIKWNNYKASTPWFRDNAKLQKALHVVDNWEADLYKEVAASKGGMGAGGGPPLQAWAEELPPPPQNGRRPL